MTVGQSISVKGCVGKQKFLAGQSLRSVERILGYHAGRLAQGLYVAGLSVLPKLDQFELRAYTIVPGHRYSQPAGLNIGKIKQMARESWALSGGERLLKVYPVTAHSDDMEPNLQYPPGLGAPQWTLVEPLPGTVLAFLTGYPDATFPTSL